MLASIRPDSWNFPLFVHVFGAMVLVGGLIAASLALLLSRRAQLLQGLGFRFLLFLALPGFVAMRGGAAWIYSKEGFSGDNDPAWIGIGFATADIGVPVFLVTLILAGIGARRARAGAGGGLTRAAGILACLLLAAYVVTVWAMAGKPS
jgi:hypothetical protein